ncbi:MAG TPA: glycosyltransferase family 2 protein [Pyrinomonadaceae bacterium]|nr:glycosyltransferase family 2 protein [Pyrinomonadaceae bacterium]
MKVTVITAAYNRADLIEETIESVLGQDYSDLEYIVLDDGSTDATLEVIKKYEGRIAWDSHPNMGETATVNKGFEMATGEIIAVVSSDDPLLPGAVKAAVSCFNEHPEVLVAYPDWNMIDERGEIIRHYRVPEYDYAHMVGAHHCLPGPGTFFRRSVVERLGGRDPEFRYVGDYDFWLRAGLLGPFKRLPRTLATFRRHEGGATQRERGGRMAREHIRVIARLYERRDLPAEVRRLRRAAFASAYRAAGDASTEARARRSNFRRAVSYGPLKFLADPRDRYVLREAFGRFYALPERVFNSLKRRLT